MFESCTPQYKTGHPGRDNPFYGAADGTRTRTVSLPGDFKSPVSTDSTTAACGCERLDSNQRSPAYEAGDLPLVHSAILGSLKSYPGLHLSGWLVPQVRVTRYNHKQSPPCRYLNNVLNTKFTNYIEPLDFHQWEQRIIRRSSYLNDGV